ncbi:MAG: GDSL-type esterase/lipase family protein [Saprospiraceae bacterium]
MKRLLYSSLIIILLLLGAIIWAIQKLGGFGYVWHRVQHREWGVYYHRAQHFGKLPEEPGAIIFLGDSQIQSAEWHEVFRVNKPVLNRGISGDYTAGVLERLDEVLRHKPSKLFLLVGINDLFFGKEASEIEPDYRKIVQRTRSESSATELFLLSVLPVNNKVRKLGIKNAEIQTLNNRIRQIARDFAVPYVDLSTPLTDADGNLASKFTDDGLHINGLGYVVVKNSLGNFISDNWQ